MEGGCLTNATRTPGTTWLWSMGAVQLYRHLLFGRATKKVNEVAGKISTNPSSTYIVLHYTLNICGGCSYECVLWSTTALSETDRLTDSPSISWDRSTAPRRFDWFNSVAPWAICHGWSKIHLDFLPAASPLTQIRDACFRWVRPSRIKS